MSHIYDPRQSFQKDQTTEIKINQIENSPVKLR